jgi:hypothetical protein
MDPGVLPSRYISTTAFKFCRDDATRESYVAALFDCSNVPNIRVIPPWLMKLPPDGSFQNLLASFPPLFMIKHRRVRAQRF